LGTGGGSFNALVPLTAHRLTPFGFAGLAPLGFILETLVGKEQLFPCGENEVGAAIDAFEDPIPVFHAPPI
jgi:hypothetical protein